MKLYCNKFIVVGMIATILSSCCDPKPRNSYPLVIKTSYSDSAIKDARDIIAPIDPLDSAFYPIYSLDIKNTGTDADTFYLSYDRGINTISLQVQQYVLSGETKTFRTFGPIPSNSLDTAKIRYYSFFVSTKDSIALGILQPKITIHYAQTPNSSEECGSPGHDMIVDPLKLIHK